MVTREAPSSDNHLLFPGHVFPEFKESDAMFAAERVSLGSAGVTGVGAFGRKEGGPGTLSCLGFGRVAHAFNLSIPEEDCCASCAKYVMRP